MLGLQLKFARFIRNKFNISIEQAYACEALQIYVELGEALSETNRERRLEEFIDVMCFMINMNESPYAPVNLHDIESIINQSMVDTLHSKEAAQIDDAIIDFMKRGSAYFNYNHFSKYWKTKKMKRESGVTQALWADYFKALLVIVRSYGYTEDEVRDKFKLKLAVNYRRQRDGY